MESINERISQLIKHLGLNKNSFARSLGVKFGGSIENIVGKRQSKPGADMLQLIIQKHPSVNAHWLLTGEGAMIKPEAKAETLINPTIQQNTAETVILEAQLAACKAERESERTAYHAVIRENGILDYKVQQYQAQLRAAEEQADALRKQLNELDTRNRELELQLLEAQTRLGYQGLDILSNAG